MRDFTRRSGICFFSVFVFVYLADTSLAKFSLSPDNQANLIELYSDYFDSDSEEAANLLDGLSLLKEGGFSDQQIFEFANRAEVNDDMGQIELPFSQSGNWQTTLVLSLKSIDRKSKHGLKLFLKRINGEFNLDSLYFHSQLLADAFREKNDLFQLILGRNPDIGDRSAVLLPRPYSLKLIKQTLDGISFEDNHDKLVQSKLDQIEGMEALDDLSDIYVYRVNGDSPASWNLKAPEKSLLRGPSIYLDRRSDHRKVLPAAMKRFKAWMKRDENKNIKISICKTPAQNIVDLGFTLFPTDKSINPGELHAVHAEMVSREITRDIRKKKSKLVRLFKQDCIVVRLGTPKRLVPGKI